MVFADAVGGAEVGPGRRADPPEFRVEPLADGSFEFHVHTVSVWITKRGALELIELLYRDVIREGERS